MPLPCSASFRCPRVPSSVPFSYSFGTAPPGRTLGFTTPWKAFCFFPDFILERYFSLDMEFCVDFLFEDLKHMSHFLLVSKVSNEELTVGSFVVALNALRVSLGCFPMSPLGWLSRLYSRLGSLSFFRCWGRF